MGLLRTLQPSWWFSAHLHVRFEARIVHENGPSGSGPAQGHNPDEITIDDDEDDTVPALPEAAAPLQKEPANPDEITLDDEEEEVVAVVVPPPLARRETRFLALDKCLPRRQFLEVRISLSLAPRLLICHQVVDIPTPTDSASTEEHKISFKFDPEWLAIVRAFNKYMSLRRNQDAFPEEEEARDSVQRELEWVQANITSMEIEEHQTFVQSAPGPGKEEKGKSR